MKQQFISEKKEPPGMMPHFFEALNSVGIPIPKALPNTQANHSIYENGLSHLLHRLKLKVHTDIDVCNALWDQFSPKQTVFHSWFYRYAWSKAYGLIPHFYTIYEGSNPLAMLALSYNPTLKRYTWFGSYESWMEDNRFFVKDDKFVNLLLKVLPTPYYLNAIDSIPFNSLYENIFKADDVKFFKNLTTLQTIDDYFASLNKKCRYNLKRDINFIEQYKPIVEIVSGNEESHLAKMAQLSIERFSAKDEESNFLEEERYNGFREMIQPNDEYKVLFLKVSIQNRVVGIDMIQEYNHIWSIPRGGADANRFPGIGSYMIYQNILEGLKHNIKVIDVLQSDEGGYKKRLFDERPMWKIEKE